MTLEDWRQGQSLTYFDLAVRLGVNAQATAWRWCLPPADPRQQVPRKSDMAAIWRETRGAVDPNSFYDLPAPPGAATEAAAAATEAAE